MAKKKLKIVRDEKMEDQSRITIESCSAFIDEDNNVSIIGELLTKNGKKIDDYKELQMIVFDKDGDIIEREYTNWSEFGTRRSFKEEIDLSDFDIEVGYIKVYPV